MVDAFDLFIEDYCREYNIAELDEKTERELIEAWVDAIELDLRSIMPIV